jgi:hypothetical protein
VPEPDKPPPVEELVQVGKALKELIELAEGLRFHMAETSDYGQSLALIAEFFANIGYQDIAQYIGRLGLALLDRDRGINDEILTRRGKKLKRDPTQKWRGRMWAALGYECLLKSGMTQPAADRHIDMKYRRLKPLLRGRGNLKTSVRAWHLGFMNQDKMVPQELHRSFRELYAMARLSENLPKDEYRQRGRNFLHKAIEIAATVDPRALRTRDPQRGLASNKSSDLSKTF